MLEWVAISSSRESSQPRDWTWVSYLAHRFFMAEPPGKPVCVLNHLVVSDSLWPCGLQPSRLLCPWDSPGKKTGVGCHALLQGIFPTQGLNMGLLRCRQIFFFFFFFYHLSHWGSQTTLQIHMVPWFHMQMVITLLTWCWLWKTSLKSRSKSTRPLWSL